MEYSQILAFYKADDSMSDEEASKYAEEEIIRIAHIPD